MKEYLSQCVRVALTMLIALCFTSCGIFDEILEASMDVASQRYTGTSYVSPYGTSDDVGFNVAYLMLSPVMPRDRTSFLQPMNTVNINLRT